MAVAAAKDMDALEALTRRVEQPCRQKPLPHGRGSVTMFRPGMDPGAFCAWIPAGIAVVPQLQKTIKGAVEWVPAR